MEVINPSMKIIEYYHTQPSFLGMQKQYRIYSLDFPLINHQQYDQRQRMASQTVEIVKQSLEKQQKKCLRKLSVSKEKEMGFKEVQNGLKNYNKHQSQVGSIGMNILNRANTPPKYIAVIEKNKQKILSAYLTTYQSYNRKLEICRRTPSQQSKENVLSIRKKTTVQRIIAPKLTPKPSDPHKLKLKIENSRH